jgi:ribosome biogenesis ATPase
VIAATSRPESLDQGLRRAGRLDREVGLPIPDENARAAILRVLSARMRLEPTLTTSFAAGSGRAPTCGSRGSGAAEPDAVGFSKLEVAAPSAGARVAPPCDLQVIARATPGFVGADLLALTKEAAACAVNRVFGAGRFMRPSTAPLGSLLTTGMNPASGSGGQVIADGGTVARSAALSQDELCSLSVSYADFLMAVPRVQPSAMREGFATSPSVTWADVGALDEVRAELEMAIVLPLRRPELFASVGLSVPAGVLLYGPPGCGKTLLAKAIASESSANFISVKGPELLDKYVGESERAVRQVFQRARSSAPCVIFFDELDALAPRRGGQGSSGGGNVSERVVNQLLTEMDGLDVRRDVFVVAATNRPDIIDPAMLRPGRLDKLLYVPLPTAAERGSILRTQVRKTPLAPDVDIAAIASDARCTRFSGADLAGLVREASVASLKELLSAPTIAVAGPVQVHQRHFIQALDKSLPSVSSADEKVYNTMRVQLRHSRSHVVPSTSAAPAAGLAADAKA